MFYYLPHFQREIAAQVERVQDVQAIKQWEDGGVDHSNLHLEVPRLDCYTGHTVPPSSSHLSL